MRTSTAHIAVLATVSALCGLWPCVAGAACEPAARPIELKFKVHGDQCVQKVVKDAGDADAETVRACVGDTIRWKVAGKGKAVVFEGDSPFDWIDSGIQQNAIVGTVRADAARNGQSTTYKYSVKVEGLACVLDPTIIVD